MASVAEKPKPSPSPPAPPRGGVAVTKGGVQKGAKGAGAVGSPVMGRRAAGGSSNSQTTTTVAGSTAVTTSAAAAAALSRANNKLCDLMPSASQCAYSPCYCEENVWKLCEHVSRSASPAELAKAWVVFVSNKKQVVPLWRQKAGKDEEKLVIWDYHAIFLYKPEEKTLVFDLDSDLPFPTYFHKYVTETFRTDAILNPEYHRFFRVVPATAFLAKFASDRRHMRNPDPEAGSAWMKPPPPYPPIKNAETDHNLDQFISMEKGQGLGEVICLKEFVQRFFRN